MKRTLVLRREALTDLSAEDLDGVAGGIPPSQVSCPLTDCIPFVINSPTPQVTHLTCQAGCTGLFCP